MNVNALISRFFSDTTPAIEVFDQKNIYAVYVRLQEMLRDMPDIELSVLQALAYCFYEVMDNVLIHSGKPCAPALKIRLHPVTEWDLASIPQRGWSRMPEQCF